MVRVTPKEAQAMKDAYAKMYAPKEEPKVEAPKSPLGQSYNPFAESVEEKAYRSVKVEESPRVKKVCLIENFSFGSSFII